MAWRVVYQKEEEAAAHVGLQQGGDGGPEFGMPYMIVPVTQSIGKRIRITVEEEVRECCEKWRGKDVCIRECLRAGTYVVGARCVPTFCPECGWPL